MTQPDRPAPIAEILISHTRHAIPIPILSILFQAFV